MEIHKTESEAFSDNNSEDINKNNKHAVNLFIFFYMILRCDVGVLKCHRWRDVDGWNFNGAY